MDVESELVRNGRALGVRGLAGVLSGRVPDHTLDDQALVGYDNSGLYVVVQFFALKC